MKEYLLILLGVSLLSGIVSILAPDGKLKRYIRLLTGLVVLCVLIRPALSLLKSAGDGIFDTGEAGREESVSAYDDIYNNNLKEAGEREVAKRLKDKIIKEFDVGEESIDVKAEFVSENDRYRVSTVWLTIRKGAVSTDPRKLVEYVENLLDCQCVIVYE